MLILDILSNFRFSPAKLLLLYNTYFIAGLCLLFFCHNSFIYVSYAFLYVSSLMFVIIISCRYSVSCQNIKAGYQKTKGRRVVFSLFLRLWLWPFFSLTGCFLRSLTEVKSMRHPKPLRYMMANKSDEVRKEAASFSSHGNG